MKKILVAVDGSEHSHKVIGEAAELAAALKADVVLLTVMEEFMRGGGMTEIGQNDVDKINEGRKNHLEKFLQEAGEKFKEKGLKVNARLSKGQPWEVICNTAREEDFSHIVLGSRGMGGFAELLLGSVSNKVAHCSDRNVIIVK